MEKEWTDGSYKSSLFIIINLDRLACRKLINNSIYTILSLVLLRFTQHTEKYA